MITYHKNNKNIPIDQFNSLLKNTLDRRPVNQNQLLQSMIDHSNILMTAWDDKELIGLCRGFTDFAYVSYISDLAVLPIFQKKGIGKQLLNMTRDFSGPHCKLVLLSSENANSYYNYLGFTPHNRAWVHEAD